MDVLGRGVQLLIFDYMDDSVHDLEELLTDASFGLDTTAIESS